MRPLRLALRRARARVCCDRTRVFGHTVRDQSCHLVTVLGDAGVGKSRLVREVLEGLPRDVMVLRGRCLPYGEGITYWPLAEIVREITRTKGLDRGGQETAALAALLTGEEKAWLVAERVAEAIGLGNTGRATSEETFWAVRRLFEFSRKRAHSSYWWTTPLGRADVPRPLRAYRRTSHVVFRSFSSGSQGRSCSTFIRDGPAGGATRDIDPCRAVHRSRVRRTDHESARTGATSAG